MIETDVLSKAYYLMFTARAMAQKFEANRQICRYVHATSSGHEAIQLATAFQLRHFDYVSPYYRDDSMLLGLGFTPFQLMLQLLAKGTDIFTGGREYYSHPNYRSDDKPTIIHQSSATGMQAIPATGIAEGIQFLEKIKSPLYRNGEDGEAPVVVCSMGDASLAEGEVSEALQVSVAKQLPIIYLVQDNDWGISVTSKEVRSMNAYRFARGFRGLERISVDGSNFSDCFRLMKKVVSDVRRKRFPCLIHATVPLLNHHTSGVRKEFYRSDEDLAKHALNDPLQKLKKKLLVTGFMEEQLLAMEDGAAKEVNEQFQQAIDAPEPDVNTISDFIFLPTPVTLELGERSPATKGKVLMVDAALYAIREILEQYPECVFYGQDVGRRLGGVFREAATLAEQFGDHRVFNTGIQEAYIIGSTAGMCATGVKPIVEIQFADYIYPGFNQLVAEIAKSCYLSCGKFPLQTIIRVPVGAYGGGGPYHSACIETTLLSIKGLKIVYPSNAADMKGLMKAAFLDPNPVIMLEHKGLYWSKVPGTEDAKSIEPHSNYILPLGIANVVVKASDEQIKSGNTCCIITYGMGIYWAKAACKNFKDQVDVIDLRTLFPLDEELVFSTVQKHGKCIVLTEEQQNNSFAEALAGRISKNCFTYLDAPVEVIGALNLPAVPLNISLEKAMLPNAEKVSTVLERLLAY